MSYTERDLMAEIEGIVETLYRRETRINANDVTLHVIAQHMPEFGAGESFACHCAWHTTRKAVGGYLTRQFKDDTGNVKQMRFPGFDHLQMAYLIGDDHDPCVVPLDQATARELDQIADRLEKEGRSKLKHAVEVRKYRRARFGDAQAAA